MSESLTTVFVPGLLCSPRLYEPVLPSAWAFGPITVADTRRDPTLIAIAQRLLGTTPSRFALVGLSMGGYIALEVMRQAPERVAGLALMSTSARPDTPEQSAARSDQIAAARNGHFDDLVQAAFPQIVAPSNASNEHLREGWRAMAADVGPDVFCRQQAAITQRPDSRPLLQAITCPTLVIHGNDDQLIPVENGQELGSGIPGAHLELMNGVGHSPTLEAPEATAGALSALLSRVTGSGEAT